MKVYVITKGDYSEYHICAVETDNEKAQILKEKFSTEWSPASIEEFDTENYNPIFQSKKFYNIYFDKNGNVKKTYEDGLEYFDPNDNPVTIFRDGDVKVDVFAFDQKSAIKIAAEKRAIELSKRGYV